MANGHQSPRRAYEHGWFAQVCMPAELPGNTIIAAAQACMLQPPRGGQAAMPSLQPDSVTVTPFLLCAANAWPRPLNGTCLRRCRHLQSRQMFVWSKASKIKSEGRIIIGSHVGTHRPALLFITKIDVLSCKHLATRHKCKMVDGCCEPTSDHVTAKQDMCEQSNDKS